MDKNNILIEESPWKTYGIYRLLLCAWMLNDVVTTSAVSDISHEGYYFKAIFYIIGVIILGIPLVYSELCIIQYTNCDNITFWNFFPLFRSAGYGMIFLSILKCLYLLILTSWYLEYTFYSALDPPPWYTCEDFNRSTCMVKRINVSIFQHCIEMQNILDDECGIKTASNYFFMREIGKNTTRHAWPYCYYYWKLIVTKIIICFTLFLLSIRPKRNIEIAIKMSTIYVVSSIFALFYISLSAYGSWNVNRINASWDRFDLNNVIEVLTESILSMGTGYGVSIFLSRDIPFRSHAAMTSILIPLTSMFFTIMLAFITFNGITAMSHYHGEETNIMEIENNAFFIIFASMSEILSYFNGVSFWTFLWFSNIFVCLYMNLWILYLFIEDFTYSYFKKKHNKGISFGTISSLCLISTVFHCSDLAASLIDAIEIIQIIQNLMFSIALYWIYGINKHKIDILFMIGIKTSYFWKITWFCSPIFLTIVLYGKVISLKISVNENNSLLLIKSPNITADFLTMYILLSFFVMIIIIGIIADIIYFLKYDNIRNIVLPTADWGPKDEVLYRSRKMFVPEIMTTEFLYRQKKIRAFYNKTKSIPNKFEKQDSFEATSIEKTEWSIFTSN